MYPFLYNNTHEFTVIIIIEPDLSAMGEYTQYNVCQHWFAALREAFCNMSQSPLDLFLWCNHGYVLFRLNGNEKTENIGSVFSFT